MTSLAVIFERIFYANLFQHHIRQTLADGRIPCAIYMSEPWFHQDLTREGAETMFKHCKNRQGYVEEEE